MKLETAKRNENKTKAKPKIICKKYTEKKYKNGMKP